MRHAAILLLALMPPRHNLRLLALRWWGPSEGQCLFHGNTEKGRKLIMQHKSVHLHLSDWKFYFYWHKFYSDRRITTPRVTNTGPQTLLIYILTLCQKHMKIFLNIQGLCIVLLNKSQHHSNFAFYQGETSSLQPYI